MSDNRWQECKNELGRMRQRAEKAEALLKELAVAAIAVPVELGQRLDEYLEDEDE